VNTARALTLDIEVAMGRKPGVRWQPRTIDIDVVLYGEERISLPNLTVPHPRMLERAFVVRPLLDIDPELSVPGAGAVAILLPRANGTYAEWDAGVGAGNYTDLNEIPPNDDTTYMTTSTNTKRLSSLVTSAATAGITGTINAVKTVVVGRDVSNTVNNQIGMRSGTTDNYTTDYDYAGAYEYRGKVYNTDPNTGAAWTLAAIDSVQPIHKHTQSQSRVLRCTWQGIMVDYTPPAVTSIPNKIIHINRAVQRASIY